MVASVQSMMGTLFIMAAVSISTTLCDSQDEAYKTVFWQTIGGYAVIGVLIVVFGGGVSLCAWLICMCHEKSTKKRRVGEMELTSGTRLTEPPAWGRQLVILPHLASQGFGDMSDGMKPVDTYHVIRQRKGQTHNDGARWAVPLTKGKHLFEIIWPWGQRGYASSVGVGTDRASLMEKTKKALVGNNEESWGLNIVSRRVYHSGKVVGGQYPPDGSFVPERFLMYVDLDTGTLGYGTDVSFWGFRVNGLPTDGNTPIFPMVASDKWQAGIRMYYKGSADPNRSGIPPGPSTLLNSYAMPPPPGPAFIPSAAPPAYMEVEPAPGPHGKGAIPPQPIMSVPPESAVYVPPPPYTAGPPPSAGPAPSAN